MKTTIVKAILFGTSIGLAILGLFLALSMTVGILKEGESEYFIFLPISILALAGWVFKKALKF